MPRRVGATVAPISEKWKQGMDGEWYAEGKAQVKGRLRYATRKRRNRIGKIKASHKARRRTD